MKPKLVEGRGGGAAPPARGPRPAFLRTLRTFAQAWQAFEDYSRRHVQALGLTPAQFDIVATLGDTPGMAFRELGARTLITKGTLTGVVDRLQAQGLVERVPDPSDGRVTVVRLTRAGERCYRRVFDAHVAHLARVFGTLGPDELAALERRLGTLRDRFRAGGADDGVV